MFKELFLIVLALIVVQPNDAPPVIQGQTETKVTPDPELAERFLKVRKIYVESFGEDSTSKQLQAMLISSLTMSKRFVVTENREKADAILKGAALEKTSQELHVFGEGTAASVATGGYGGSVSRSRFGDVSGEIKGGFAAVGAAIEDKSANTETINDARLAVRLVHADGDVIWATVQESRGAKYKGASADVADKVVKQLLRDLERLEKRLEAGKRTP